MSDKNWIQIFKWFHSNPELSFQENATTKKIHKILKEEEIEIIPTNLSTGLIAVIRGNQEGKSICLRGDIDALPIQEQTNLPYSSQTLGVMHACGHDFHTTVALAVASKISRFKELLKGTLYIAFEPGEEAFHGAKKILQTGVLSNVSEFYGFHADPSLGVGEIGIKSGGVMASVDKFRINVKGVGTHAAAPHLGNNPITVVTSIISALKNFAAREISSIHPHVISFTHIEGGSTWNIIPQTAFCEGTVRTLNDEDRKIIQAAFKRIVSAYGELTETECELEWTSGASAVINSEQLCKTAASAAAELKLKSVNSTPEMVSDDFSLFTQQNKNSKGLYLRIGTGKGFPLHHPQFKIDIKAIDSTSEFISTVLLKALT